MANDIGTVFRQELEISPAIGGHWLLHFQNMMTDPDYYGCGATN